MSRLYTTTCVPALHHNVPSPAPAGWWPRWKVGCLRVPACTHARGSAPRGARQRSAHSMYMALFRSPYKAVAFLSPAPAACPAAPEVAAGSGAPPPGALAAAPAVPAGGVCRGRRCVGNSDGVWNGRCMDRSWSDSPRRWILRSKVIHWPRLLRGCRAALMSGDNCTPGEAGRDRNSCDSMIVNGL